MRVCPHEWRAHKRREVSEACSLQARHSTAQKRLMARLRAMRETISNPFWPSQRRSQPGVRAPGRDCLTTKCLLSKMHPVHPPWGTLSFSHEMANESFKPEYGHDSVDRPRVLDASDESKLEKSVTIGLVEAPKGGAVNYCPVQHWTLSSGGLIRPAPPKLQ